MNLWTRLTIGLAFPVLAGTAEAQMPGVAEACRWQPDPSQAAGARILVTADTMLAMRGLLMSGSFAALEMRLTGYDSAARADVRNEDAWQTAYRSFYIPLPDITAHLDAWVSASPQSAHAHMARAYHRIRRSSAARSGMIVPDTGGEKALEWAKLAFDDLKGVLSEPSPHPHSLLALSILTQGSEGGLSQRALDAALVNSPSSVVIREQYSRTLRPWSGGGLDTMRAFAKASQRHAKQNPRLRVLLGYPAWEEAESLKAKKDTPGSLAKYNEALTYGDAADFRIGRAAIFYTQRRDDLGIADLDCAIALAPWRVDALASRGISRIRLGAAFEGERALELQRNGLADLRMASQLNRYEELVSWAGRSAEAYLRPEVVEAHFGRFATFWRTLRDIFSNLWGWGVFALVSVANVLAWRRHRFWIPPYVHVLAAGALGVILWLNWLWVRAGGAFTFRRLIIVVFFPALVYFVFITYGGAKAAFARRPPA